MAGDHATDYLENILNTFKNYTDDNESGTTVTNG